jgi:hypothetical protein
MDEVKRLETAKLSDCALLHQTVVGGSSSNEIEISSKSRDALEKWASKLLAAFKAGDNLELSAKNWRPDFLVSHSITAEQVRGPVIRETPSPVNNGIVELAILFENRSCELDEQGCQILDGLAERWFNEPRVRCVTTEAAMRNRLVRWCIRVLASGTYESCVDFQLSSLQQNVRERNVWVVVADLEVEGELTLGKVTFKEVNSVLAEEITKPVVQLNGASERLKEDVSKHWQGRTAAVYMGFGDEGAVRSQAVENTERACALLRLLSPAINGPNQRSYLGPATLESQQPIERMLFDVGTPHLAFKTGIKERHNNPCHFPLEKRDQQLKGPLGDFQGLLGEQRSQFGEHLLRSVIVFSRASLTSNPIEKLIFANAGLEAMLLAGNESSPIMKTVRRRLIGSLAGSKEVASDIRHHYSKAYKMRSKFLHHGITNSQAKIVEKFLCYACLYFLRVIRARSRWDSIHAHVKSLDESFASRFKAEWPDDLRES